MKTLTRTLNVARALVAAARSRRGATPHQVVWRSGPARLRAYRPERASPRATPLLLVTPIINRFRVVDLEPQTSLVGGLLARGVPVYVVDWGAPARIDARLDLEGYVLRLLPAAARAARADAGGEGALDVLGYCLGGTLATLFAATQPERVRRLVTLCAPVRFSCDAPHMDLLRRWVAPDAFPVEELTRALGNMPGALIHQGFLWQRPVASALKPLRAWRRCDDAAFARSYALLEAWTLDGVDLPGAAYRTLIQALYRDDALFRGRLALGERAVDLGRIRCPVLVVTAEGDTTCPPAAARALLDRVGTPPEGRAELSLPGGHVAAVVGRRAPRTLHGPLADWLLA